MVSLRRKTIEVRAENMQEFKQVMLQELDALPQDQPLFATVSIEVQGELIPP